MTQQSHMDDDHTTAARSLRDRFAGDIHLAGDDGYDELRLAWNRGIDPRPAIVAEPTGVRDVQAAVLSARENDLPLAVQSTGHGTLRPCDSGLLLRTGRMNEVTVDPERRTATVGVGALWSDVIEATAPHGLAPISGTPSVGVAGYTLGGGVGWLSREYGYAADSLLRAEIVTSAGTVVTADREQNPELFWALRGGSGNFGLVTSMEMRLYPVGQVCAGTSFYPVENAGEALRCYREWALEEPDWLSTAVLLMQMPPFEMVPEIVRGKKVLGLRVFSTEPPEPTWNRLKPLLDAVGSPLVNAFAPMPFAEAGTAITGPPPPPMAARQHIDLFHQVPDAAVDAVLEAAGEGAGTCVTAVEVRHWGGAMARPDENSGPVGHRDVPFSIITTGMFTGIDEPAAVEAAVDGLGRSLQPYAAGGTFLNFLTDLSRTETAYTAENLARLSRVKKSWDPDNFFRINHNIAPGS